MWTYSRRCRSAASRAIRPISGVVSIHSHHIIVKTPLKNTETQREGDEKMVKMGTGVFVEEIRPQVAARGAAACHTTASRVAGEPG